MKLIKKTIIIKNKRLEYINIINIFPKRKRKNKEKFIILKELAPSNTVVQRKSIKEKKENSPFSFFQSLFFPIYI